MKVFEFEKVTPCGLIRVGLSIGVLVVTAAIAYSEGRKSVQREADERVDEIRYHYREALGRVQNEIDLAESSISPERDSENRPQKVEDRRPYLGEPIRPEATQALKEYGAKTITAGGFPDSYLEEDPPHIEVLSCDRFYNERTNEDDIEYEKASAIYYAKDDVAVDAYDEPLTDAMQTLGNRFRAYLQSGTDEYYIRNHKLRMDYEIVRTDLAYAESVLGLEDTIAQKKGRV